MRPSPFAKLKSRTREPSGRPQRERVADIIATASRNRIRMGVKPEEARNQLAGSVFGRLYLIGSISRTQYQAGEQWARLIIRYGRILGIPPLNPKSPAMIMVAGFDCIEEISMEEAAKVRSRYDDTYAAISDLHDGRSVLNALKTIILHDQPGDIGALKTGLNRLMTLWRMTEDEGN